MTPLYKIPSGNFAGWKDDSTDKLYNKSGINVGYFIGDVAYSLNGDYIGEITDGDYIGKRSGRSYPSRHPRVPSVAISRVQYVDRVGRLGSGWNDPDF